MRKIVTALAAIAVGISIAPAANATALFLRGKVVLEGGAPPGKLVSIEQRCTGRSPKIVATAGKSGEYLWRAEGSYLGLEIVTGSSDSTGGSFLVTTGTGTGLVTPGAGTECVLLADLSGYHSSTIDLTDSSLVREPRLPVLVLSPDRPGLNLDVDSTGFVPGPVRKAWAAAQKALLAQNWEEGARQLQSATATDPKFRLGWIALGLAYNNQKKPAEAREAFRRAVALDAKPLPTQLMLARANLNCQDWAETVRTAGTLIAADARHRYLEAYLFEAIARYHLRDLDGAEARVKELLQLDKAHQIPRAEYVLGLILQERTDLAAAREHMQKFLELQPEAPDAPAARARIEDLGKPQATSADTEIDAPNLVSASPGETSVPGGLKAFALMAHLEATPTYENFFLEYCRWLLLDASPYATDHIPAFGAQLQAYMAAVTELSAAGQKRSDDTVLVRLSMTGDEERKKTGRLLHYLGWRLDLTGESPKVELGDEPSDGVCQRIPAVLGIDEIAMRDALEAGRSYEFEVHSDTARLIGGVSWAAALKDIPPFPGGMAEVFSRDLRFAKAYAGLGVMSVDTAFGLISTIGVRDLVTRYADVLSLCSSAFAVSGGGAATPGGPAAAPTWAKLAGADAARPGALFRALLTKDGGRLAVFYAALSQADEAHQRFFTADAGRMQRFYEWYRDSIDMRFVKDRLPESWRRELFAKLPLDGSGRVRFPGGRAAWSNSSGTDEDVLLRSDTMEALVPVASLEETRGAPLDAASVGLLARHYAEWRSLFPYFEHLPALGAAEFQALVSFSEAASNQPLEARNTLVGEWHSLVKLIVLGAQAGSLDEGDAARALRRVSAALAGPDPSPNALAVLREVAGPQGSVDEAVATRLLRLSGPRRADFDLVRQLQTAPTIDSALASPTPSNTLAALSGAVYAALLSPKGLLVSEDPGALRRHRFIPVADPKIRTVFFPTDLVRTYKYSASHMTGGFMTFEEIARGLATHKVPVESAAAPAPAPARGRGRAPEPAARTQSAAAGSAAEVVFRASGRLVEVNATVTDGRKRYVDNMAPADFVLLDNGKPMPLASFENQSSTVSVALLFDATGSMEYALPPLKRAALKLIGEMRPEDVLAVYSFNSAVSELQPFTTDKRAAERAVLQAHALGGTALYDALVRVNRDLSARAGKKAIVVFTDGDDNLSTLSAEIAIARAKAAGASIYTIAQGEALRRPEFLDMLAGISKATGGLPFAIHDPAEILKVFESVSNDLTHGYLLTFQPSSGEVGGWHAIKVTLRAVKGRTVRAREAYLLE